MSIRSLPHSLLFVAAVACAVTATKAHDRPAIRSRSNLASCPKGGDYKDGCSVAPPGSAVFNDALDSYRAPPPWNVAGIDFRVGVPHRLLKDPASARLPQGCGFAGTTVACSGPVSLDGFDFSLHGGITLAITGGEALVRNCLFVVGANQGALGRILDVSGASAVTFINNEFDGAGIPVTPQKGQMIDIKSIGQITFRYNYFHDSGGDMIDFSGGPQINIVQYNLFKDIGLKTAHSDTLQWCGSVIRDSDLSFNTFLQSKAGLSGMGLLTINAECAGAQMSNILVHNNTFISKRRDNFATGANVTQDAGPAAADHVAVFDNYLDPGGIMAFTASPWFPAGFYGSELPRPSSLHSLWNMRTGADIPPASRLRTGSSKRYYVYPDRSGYSPSLGDFYAISAKPQTGTVSAGDVVLFTLEMDEPWVVTGAPNLLLNSGGVATYAGGSGSGNLSFSYLVRSGETAAALAITGFELNKAQVTDRFGNEVNMDGIARTFHGLQVR